MYNLLILEVENKRAGFSLDSQGVRSQSADIHVLYAQNKILSVISLDNYSVMYILHKKWLESRKKGCEWEAIVRQVVSAVSPVPLQTTCKWL